MQDEQEQEPTVEQQGEPQAAETVPEEPLPYPVRTSRSTPGTVNVRRLIDLLSERVTIYETARKLGVSHQAVEQWLTKPWVRRRINRRRQADLIAAGGGVQSKFIKGAMKVADDPRYIPAALRVLEAAETGSWAKGGGVAGEGQAPGAISTQVNIAILQAMPAEQLKALAYATGVDIQQGRPAAMVAGVAINAVGVPMSAEREAETDARLVGARAERLEMQRADEAADRAMQGLAPLEEGEGEDDDTDDTDGGDDSASQVESETGDDDERDTTRHAGD